MRLTNVYFFSVWDNFCYNKKKWRSSPHLTCKIFYFIDGTAPTDIFLLKIKSSTILKRNWQFVDLNSHLNGYFPLPDRHNLYMVYLYGVFELRILEYFDLSGDNINCIQMSCCL